jgi:hypothetical protein
MCSLYLGTKLESVGEMVITSTGLSYTAMKKCDRCRMMIAIYYTDGYIDVELIDSYDYYYPSSPATVDDGREGDGLEKRRPVVRNKVGKRKCKK